VHNWLAQFVPCVAAEKEAKVATPHTIAKNKMKFLICLSCRSTILQRLGATTTTSELSSTRKLRSGPPTETTYALY
jgi:hypothetical protein